MTLIDQSTQIRPATPIVTTGRQPRQEGSDEFGRWMTDTSRSDRAEEDLAERGDSGLGGGPSLIVSPTQAAPGGPGFADGEDMTAPPVSTRFSSAIRETAPTDNLVSPASGVAEPAAVSVPDGVATSQTIGTPAEKLPAAVAATPIPAAAPVRPPQDRLPAVGSLPDMATGGSGRGPTQVERDASVARGPAAPLVGTLPGDATSRVAGRLVRGDLAKAEALAASGEPQAEAVRGSDRTPSDPAEPEPRVGPGAPAQTAGRVESVAPVGMPSLQADPASLVRSLPGDGDDPAVETLRGMEPGQRADDSRAAQLAQVRAGQILPQVAEALVRRLAAEGATVPGGEVEIRLDPPELGRIRIGFTGLDGALSGIVSAERSDVEAFLRRHADVLERALADAGFANISLQFGASSGGHDGRTDSPPVADADLAAGHDAPMSIARTTWGIANGDRGRLDIRL